MDPVYTAQVYHRLLQLSQLIAPNPETENIPELTSRYQQIHSQWKELDTEIEHLKARIKNAMKTQNINDIHGFKLGSITRKSYSISLNNLADAVHKSAQEFDLSIKLTQAMQKALADIIQDLSIQEDIETIVQLKIKDVDEYELPF
jgi:ribonuclease D